MAEKTIKGIRLSEDAQRLLKLMAAYEDKTEGTIVEEALPLYLQMRSLSYGQALDVSRELASSTPDTVGDIVHRLSAAIENALAKNEHAPPAGTSKERLKARRATTLHATG